MLLLDDPAGQRQTHSPAAGLAGDAGLEQLVCISGATPGPSSRTLDARHRVATLDFDSIRPPRPLNACNGILHDHLERHSISTGSPVAVVRAPGDVSVIVTMRERRQPRPEVGHHALGDRAQFRRALRREGRPMRSKRLATRCKALRIRLKMTTSSLPGVPGFSRRYQSNREAHEWCAELMGRLARQWPPTAGRAPR